MKMVLLKTAEMPEVPAGVRVLINWGEVIVYMEDDDRYVSGEHIIVDGEEKDVLAWLRSVPWVWMQKPGTSPVRQQFEQWHF